MLNHLSFKLLTWILFHIRALTVVSMLRERYMSLFLIQYQILTTEKHTEWESNIYTIDLMIGLTDGQLKRIECKSL